MYFKSLLTSAKTQWAATSVSQKVIAVILFSVLLIVGIVSGIFIFSLGLVLATATFIVSLFETGSRGLRKPSYQGQTYEHRQY